MDINSIGTKVENEGSTMEGRLYADEFNCVVDTIKDNKEAIKNFQVGTITNWDIEELFK